MHIFNHFAKDLAMLQISPNENNIKEFYLYLHDEYQIASAEIENMRFDLQWIATPERLQIINSHRTNFQEYLQELARKVILGVDHAEANLIAYENQFPTLH